MQEQDYPRFQALMREVDVYTVLPGGKNLEDITTALFAALERWPFEAVAAAARQYYREERLFPMLSDILKRLEGGAEERAALAWASVRDVALTHGQDRSVRFGDPLIHWAVGKMGGWARLCWRVREAEPWARKDFEMFYHAGENRGVGWRDVPAFLEGNFTRRVLDAGTGEMLPGEQVRALQAMQNMRATHTQAAELVAEVARRSA